MLLQVMKEMLASSSASSSYSAPASTANEIPAEPYEPNDLQMDGLLPTAQSSVQWLSTNPTMADAGSSGASIPLMVGPFPLSLSRRITVGKTRALFCSHQPRITAESGEARYDEGSVSEVRRYLLQESIAPGNGDPLDEG